MVSWNRIIDQISEQSYARLSIINQDRSIVSQPLYKAETQEVEREIKTHFWSEKKTRRMFFGPGAREQLRVISTEWLRLVSPDDREDIGLSI